MAFLQESLTHHREADTRKLSELDIELQQASLEIRRVVAASERWPVSLLVLMK